MTSHRPLRQKTFLIYILSLLIITVLTATNVYAGPGKNTLWEIKTETNNVYLMGSIHLLTKDTYPLPAELEKAYRNSEIIAFETDIEAVNSPQIQEKILLLGSLPPDSSLKKVVSDRTYELFKERLSLSGVDITVFERFKPWMCALTLSVMELQRLGFYPQYGLDNYFFGKGKKDSKKIISLEPVEYQIDLLAGLNDFEQDSLLNKTLQEIDLTEKLFKEMLLAWKSGNDTKLGALIKKSFEGYPDLYKIFITDRNGRWLPRIEELLSKDQNVLIVVGAGHLAGDNSVIDLLRKKGYQVTQK